MSIIIQCNGCKSTSPTPEGKYVADDWITLELTTQWQRGRADTKGVKMHFCRDCLTRVVFDADLVIGDGEGFTVVAVP